MLFLDFSFHPQSSNGQAQPLQKSRDIQLMLSLTLIGKKIAICYLGQLTAEFLIGSPYLDR